VPLTIDHNVSDLMAAIGFSTAARAYPITDPAAVANVIQLLGQRNPKYVSFPMPKSKEI
jgi:hypothetical protein